MNTIFRIFVGLAMMSFMVPWVSHRPWDDRIAAVLIFLLAYHGLDQLLKRTDEQ